MEYTYLENFDKTSIDNLEAIQELLTSKGVIVDSKLFPLMDEAIKGDYGANAELYEMFTFGNNNVTPNFEMSLHYWKWLHFDNINSGEEDKELISEGLNNHLFLHLQFDKMEEASDCLLTAFKYMVTNLEPHLWERQIIELFYNNMDSFIPEAEE